MTLEQQNAKLRDALTAIYEWYDRDGSVGGASNVFEDNRAALASVPVVEASTSDGAAMPERWAGWRVIDFGDGSYSVYHQGTKPENGQHFRNGSYHSPSLFSLDGFVPELLGPERDAVLDRLIGVGR